jgi:hypothetical protein
MSNNQYIENDFQKIKALIEKLGENNDSLDNTKKIIDLYEKLINNSPEYNECVTNLNFNEEPQFEEESENQIEML